MKTSIRTLFLASLLMLTGIMTSVHHVHAVATSFSIESADVGLGGADLKTTTINIIKLVLGLLTLVAVTMIIGSVVVAATSSERAEAAKKTITGAVIGLIIVLLAWAIVLFVANTTSNVTTGT